MKHKNSRRTDSDRAVGEGADMLANDTDESTLEQASADFYGRRERIRTKITKGDFWIAIGMYLTLASVAFVIL
jgi:hypothetical protein